MRVAVAYRAGQHNHAEQLLHRLLAMLGRHEGRYLFRQVFVRAVVAPGRAHAAQHAKVFKPEIASAAAAVEALDHQHAAVGRQAGMGRGQAGVGCCLQRKEFVGGQLRVFARVEALDDVGGAAVGDPVKRPGTVAHQHLGLHAGNAGIAGVPFHQLVEQVFGPFMGQQPGNALGRYIVRAAAQRGVAQASKLGLADHFQQGQRVEIGNHLGEHQFEPLAQLAFRQVHLEDRMDRSDRVVLVGHHRHGQRNRGLVGAGRVITEQIGLLLDVAARKEAAMRA